MFRLVRTGQPVMVRLCWRSLREGGLHIAAPQGRCGVHDVEECLDRYYASRWLARWTIRHFWRRRGAWRNGDD